MEVAQVVDGRLDGGVGGRLDGLRQKLPRLSQLQQPSRIPPTPVSVRAVMRVRVRVRVVELT
jgi:hypothetical protein